MMPLAPIDVARLRRPAYRAPVSVRNLLSLLVLLGLVLAPAGMAAPAAAMAMADHQKMSHHDDATLAGHPCADKGMPADGKAHDCCVMTCLGLTVLVGELFLQPGHAGMRQPIPRMRDPRGLTPEAEPPPPRFS